VDLYIHSPLCLHGVVLNSLSTGTTLPLPLHHVLSQEIDFIFVKLKVYTKQLLSGFVVLTLVAGEEFCVLGL
jgi:hypothetical protein